MIREIEADAERLASLLRRDAFRELVKELRAKERVGKVSDEAQQFLALSWFDGEVVNGGLAQYFTNPSGKDYRRVETGFRALHASEQAAVLTGFLEMLPGSVDPGDPNSVGKWIFKDDARWKASKALDAEYYRLRTDFLRNLVTWALKK